MHPQGVEIVTVSLELSGPEASRPFIEAAHPEHPVAARPEHRMDALFGVVNIPNVVWIDEQGLIVRPAEPGWPDARRLPPKMTETAGVDAEGQPGPDGPAAARDPIGAAGHAHGRAGPATATPDAIRDWVEKRPASRYALTPAEVVARSQPRSPDLSAGAAHFELANHLWRTGQRDLAIDHFNEAHRLQPGNWTYKRQAWSLVGNERVGGEFGRFVQGPLEGEEDDWPFVSDFQLRHPAFSDEGEYYPKTM